MKNNKGVTLISLTIMIVVLLILGSIGINYNSNSLKLAKLSKFTTEIEIVKTQISILNQNNNYNQYENYGLNRTIDSELINEIDALLVNKLLNIYNIASTDINAYKARFQYCTKENINEKLGLEGIEGNYLVNIQNKIVINFDGIKYNNKWYYTLEELEKDKLATNTYKVEYNEYKNPTIPKGHYYVGGTWETGYLISDSQDDKYSGNKIREIDKSIAQTCIGNLYMWIPIIEKTSNNTKGINWSSVMSEKDYTNIQTALNTYKSVYEAPVYSNDWYNTANAQYAYINSESKLIQYPTVNTTETDTQSLLSSVYLNQGIYVKIAL